MEFSEDVAKAIERLRFRIRDTNDSAYTFSSEELYEYLSQAVDELEIREYKKGIYLEDGEFRRRASGSPAKVDHADITIYTLKAHILIKMSLKDQADRDNFALRKNNLSVDTTGQSKNHAESIEYLEKQLKRLIFSSSRIYGVRVE